jgi:hypothetical protein
VLIRRIRCRATAQESALCFTTIIAIAAAIIATFVAFVSATHAANQLVITETTVKVHIKTILRKLRLHNRT